MVPIRIMVMGQVLSDTVAEYAVPVVVTFALIFMLYFVFITYFVC